MDPIIRYAPVSPFARRVGRPGPSAVAAPARVYLASPVAPAVSERDHGAELALAATRHQVALDLRDKELATLRNAAEIATNDLDKARADAEAKGYAAGEKKGEAAGRQALSAEIERVKSIGLKIEQERRAVIEGSEDIVVSIAFAALCRILGEKGTSRDAIHAMVREAMAATRSREQLTVRLHPDDAALLRNGAVEDEIRIEADQSVKLGGCIVDSAAGSLDARFETQLDLLRIALSAARARRMVDQEGC